MAQEVNFVGEGRFLIPNKASLIGTIGVEEEPAVKMLQVASSEMKKTYSAGVSGHYFVFGQEPLFSTGEPMRANFKEAEDAVIFCFKQTGEITYLYGITVPNLKEWTPPRAAIDKVDESGLLQTWKATHSDP